MHRLIGSALLIAASIPMGWQLVLRKPAPVPLKITKTQAVNESVSRLGMDGPVRAEDVYKNIDTFRGKPASQVLLAMNGIRGSLGVSCTYCHTQFEWDKNDKPAKETTRKMFKMMGYIEGTYFDHKNKVTCW